MIIKSHCGKYIVGCYNDEDTKNVIIFVTNGKDYYESIIEENKTDNEKTNEITENNTNSDRSKDIMKLLYENDDNTVISAEIKEHKSNNNVLDSIEFWTSPKAKFQKADSISSGLGSYKLSQIKNNTELSDDNSIGNKITSSISAMVSCYHELRLKYKKCLTENSNLMIMNEGLNTENDRLRENRDKVRRDVVKQVNSILNEKKRKRNNED